MASSVVKAGWSRLSRLFSFNACLAIFVGSLALGGLWGTSASAQEREVPSRIYYAAFSHYYEGEYRDALKLFQDAGRGSIKTTMARWIDSICYETMVGECYYQMGFLSEALDHYTAAVKLYVAYNDWMIRVQFPPTIQVSRFTPRIPWGVSALPARRGTYPQQVLIAQGQINNNDIIKRGGVVQQAQYRPIHAGEIVRCTTLAIRRRAELLGPLGPHDPLTRQLIAALSRRPGPPNHWSEAWIDVQLGLAYIAGGKVANGMRFLQRSLVAAGEYQHPFTSIALLELGRLAMQQGQYPKAAGYFLESSYAAVHYPDYGILEEALRLGALNHLVSNQRSIYPVLAPAAVWARRQRLRHLETSLLLCAAENYAVLGQTAEASKMLEAAKKTTGNRRMKQGRIGARWQYLASLVYFQQGKIVEGTAALKGAMAYMQPGAGWGGGSHWLFHISLADNFFSTNDMRTNWRVTTDLFTKVLRDPLASDWTFAPMESLAALNTPHSPAFEHWFTVTLEGAKEHETAIEISDSARRHAFFSSLAFGGRLQSLRWILDGPMEMLDQQAQLQRRDLLARYPKYAVVSKQAQALRKQLKEMPLVPQDQATLQKQGKALKALALVSHSQEAILHEIAVRREPASLVFPPQRSVDEIQKSLPKGHAILAFFSTRRQMYAFLLNNERYAYWPVQSPAAISQKVTALLREMGHFQRNYELSLKELSNQAWRQSGQELLELILKGSQADFSQSFEELIIVPDGLMWYVPFETLQVKVNGQLRPLISRCRIRYAPTVSLATTAWRNETPLADTAVVCGRLYLRHDDTVAKKAFADIARVVPGAVQLQSPAPAPSRFYASLFDRLIVLHDLSIAGKGPYAWTPDPIDGNKPGNTLSDWLMLPFHAPNVVILPGYHTASEDSLKSRYAVPGHEIFLPICGLMSSGVRTILLSRWRTGGKTSFDLVREFTQELPHTSPADAWQRAVFLTAASQLDLDAEPRIKRTVVNESPQAKHPFFWAGYILVDSGLPTKKPAAPVPAAPGMLKLKPAVPAAGQPPGQPPRRPAVHPPGQPPVHPAQPAVRRPGARPGGAGMGLGAFNPPQPATQPKTPVVEPPK